MRQLNKRIIQATGLTKKFNHFTAVNNISFSVKKGEIFAFLGPNGAGKTTTIKMLTIVLKPTSGQIKINGYNSQNEQNKIRQSFGIIFQDSSLDDELTALENMKFHGILYRLSQKTRQHRIKKLLGLVNLWEKRNDFVKTFSGGMRRRLEIARGLLHHPAILFLDEPTLGLDPQTRNKIWTYIKKLNLNYKTTIFFTTHYMEEAAKMAKKIVIIDHGKIIARGTTKELENKTKTKSLEDAFIALTGKKIREEGANGLDRMRRFRNKRIGKK